MEVAKTQREASGPFKRLMKNHHDVMQSTSAASVEKKVEDISSMIARVWSDDPSLQLQSTNTFRKIPSSRMIHSTENMIKSGVVTRLVEFLKRQDSPKLLHEAISNLTSDKPDVVINGAVPILVNLLSSPNDDVPEQAIWALCNVSGGSVENRDYVLSCGVLLPLLLIISTWTLANLCRGQPPPPLDQVKTVLAALEQVLRAIGNIVSGDNQHTQQSFIHANLIPILVNELDLKLKAVWELSDAQVKYLVEQSCIKPLRDLLTCPYLRTISVCLDGLENIFMVGEAQKNTGEGLVKIYEYWTLLNLCRGTPPLLFEQLEPALHSNDEQVLSDSGLELWHLSYGSEDGIESVIEAGVVPRVAQFHLHTSSVVIIHELRTLGNAPRRSYQPQAQDARDLDDADDTDPDSGSAGSSSGSGSGSAGSGSGGSGSGGSGSDDSDSEDELDCTTACVALQWQAMEAFSKGRQAAVNPNHQDTLVFENVPRELLDQFCSGWNFGNSRRSTQARSRFAAVINCMELAGKKAGRLLENLYDSSPRHMSESDHVQLLFLWSLVGSLAGRYMINKFLYRKDLEITSFADFFTNQRF